MFSMQPWCHLGSFAFSLGSHLGASSKSSSFIFWAILVSSGGPPCLYSMPLWSHHGHLALFLSGHLGLFWEAPMILLYASLVPSWQCCFFFEYQFLCQPQVLLSLLLYQFGLLWRSRPRWSTRRQKRSWSWHQDGPSKAKQDGQDSTKVA